MLGFNFLPEHFRDLCYIMLCTCKYSNDHFPIRFHYCNATFQLARSSKVTDLGVDNRLADVGLQKVMALPLLPPGEIANGVAIIEEELESNGLKNLFEPIFANLRDFWLNDSFVGEDVLSVFELDARTDNAVEQGHFLLFKKIGHARPNIWVLIRKCSQFCH